MTDRPACFGWFQDFSKPNITPEKCDTCSDRQECRERHTSMREFVHSELAWILNFLKENFGVNYEYGKHLLKELL